MWSRGIAAVALCFVVATATLAGLPGPTPTVPARPPQEQGAGQQGLMTALAQVPAAVAAWKRLHEDGRAGVGGGTTEKASAVSTGKTRAATASPPAAAATGTQTRRKPLLNRTPGAFGGKILRDS
jgi:hypothetical protein